jgi:hypothetical protein
MAIEGHECSQREDFLKMTKSEIDKELSEIRV